MARTVSWLIVVLAHCARLCRQSGMQVAEDGEHPSVVSV